MHEPALYLIVLCELYTQAKFVMLSEAIFTLKASIPILRISLNHPALPFIAACDPRIASVFEGMQPLGRLDLKVLQGLPSTVSSGKSDKFLFLRCAWFVLFVLFVLIVIIFCKRIYLKTH